MSRPVKRTALRAQPACQRQCGDRADTYQTLIGLVAVTGMREGEAVRLDRDDVDLEQGLLTIRNSKFGKSRQIPVHPTDE